MAKPFVLVKLDKDYEFKLSNKAGYYYEQLTGNSMQSMGDKFGTKEMNDLLYAGLKCIDKDLTLDKCLDLVDEHMDFEVLADVITKAMEKSPFFNPAKSKKEKHLAEK